MALKNEGPLSVKSHFHYLLQHLTAIIKGTQPILARLEYLKNKINERTLLDRKKIDRL